MAPHTKCPNCGLNEWFENPKLHYLPLVSQMNDGSYSADTTNGIHVKLWRCNNCLYVMLFWEPD